MNIKRTALVAMLSLSVGGAVAVINPQPVPASAATHKAYRNYKSMPKAIRGMWRTKGYKTYNSGKRNANVTYKINKNSYSETIRVKGKKTKIIKFPKKDIREIGYRYKNKQYYIIPKVTKKNSAYAGYMDLKPVKRHGKKALGLQSVADGKYTYFYKVKK